MRVPISLPFDRLAEVVGQTPILANMSALAALGLPSNTRLLRDEAAALALLDDPTFDLSTPLIVLSENERLQTRLQAYRIVGEPSAEVLNTALPSGLTLARSLMLRNHDVAHHIAQEVRRHRPPVVILLLIDGLSYEDVRGWGWPVQPCLVDGPSVTYRLDRSNTARVNPHIGFAALVGQPPLAARLRQMGFKHFSGFSYWQRGQNMVSDVLFQHVPMRRVQGFWQVLEALRAEPIQQGTYLQIVREGLDGLAHGKRELSRWEIDGALRAIHDDIEALVRTVSDDGALVYVTADHGILWKHEHPFELIPLQNSRPRYTESEVPDHLRVYLAELQGYAALHYPYLGAPIPINDSGVHGGLSYQESIVPFIRIEV